MLHAELVIAHRVIELVGLQIGRHSCVWSTTSPGTLSWSAPPYCRKGNGLRMSHLRYNGVRDEDWSESIV